MLKSSVTNSVNKGTLYSKDADHLSEELSRATYDLTEGDAATFLPSKSHERFLRMFLGPINVHANRKDIQLKVKEEYYSFRDRTAYLFLFFPSLLLVLRSQIWGGCFLALPIQIYHVQIFSVYRDVLRLLMLRVDIPSLLCYGYGAHQPHLGDRKATWLCLEAGIQLFLRWEIMQEIAMLLQNIFQRHRLYTRIALRKTRRMNVVWGETTEVKGQLWLLLPILLFLQAFKAYVGVLLLKIAVVGVVSEWQVVTCGILLIIMVVGSFSNIVQTLVLKSQFKEKMKRGKSKNDLTQVSSTSKD